MSLLLLCHDPAVDVDEILLERLVGNLLDKACRYHVDSGFVTSTLRSTGDHATLKVENSGPTVHAEEADALSSRSGAWTGRASSRTARWGTSKVGSA